MAVKGSYLAVAGGGMILIWSGLRGKQWSDVLRQVIAGKKPETSLTAYQITGTPANVNTSGGAVPGTKFGRTLTQAAIGTLWVAAGGDPHTASVASCIGMHESGGRTWVTSPNPDGGTNVGVWQLDTRGKGAGYTVTQLQNPLTNARVAIRGSNNGTDWSAWATAADCGV